MGLEMIARRIDSGAAALDENPFFWSHQCRRQFQMLILIEAIWNLGAGELESSKQDRVGTLEKRWKVYHLRCLLLLFNAYFTIMKLHLISLGLALGFSSSFVQSQDMAEPEPAIAIYSGGLKQFLADPLDQGLLRVLGTLDKRIMELLEETGQGPVPEPMVKLAMDLLRSPMSLRVGLGDLSQGIGPDVVWAQLDVKAGSVEEAAAMGQRIEGFLSMLPFPLQEQANQPGIKFIDIGGGMGVELGARRMEDGSGTYFVSWGEPVSKDMDLAACGVPEGSRPLFAMGIDMASLQPAIEMGLSMGGEEAQVIANQLKFYNLVGEDAWSLYMGTGAVGGRARTNMRMNKWVPMAKAMGQYSEQRLGHVDFSMFPADANMASLQIQDFSGLIQQVRNQAEMSGTSGEDFDQALVAAKEFLGFDVEADFLNTLGAVHGFYTSEATGGGGLTSGVYFMAIQDEARLRQTLGDLTERYLPMAQGRARFSKWNHAGVECTTINIPGWPIPVEISMGFSRGYLIMGLTRGALAAALDHATGGAPGLLGLPSVAAELPHSLDNLTLFTFVDAPSMVRDGYGPVSLIYSGLANAALSPTDLDRTVGMVMPSYAGLKQGTHPNIGMGWVEGDDLVIVGSASASFTANLTSLAGNPVMKAMVPALAAGIGMGWFTARESEMMSALAITDPMEDPMEDPITAHIASDISMLSAGIALYQLDHGAAPPSLEALMKDPTGEPYIWMEALPVDPWGNEYHYRAPGEAGGDWELSCWGSDAMQGGEGEAADTDHRMVENAAH